MESEDSTQLSWCHVKKTKNNNTGHVQIKLWHHDVVQMAVLHVYTDIQKLGFVTVATVLNRCCSSYNTWRVEKNESVYVWMWPKALYDEAYGVY